MNEINKINSEDINHTLVRDISLELIEPFKKLSLEINNISKKHIKNSNEMGISLQTHIEHLILNVAKNLSADYALMIAYKFMKNNAEEIKTTEDLRQYMTKIVVEHNGLTNEEYVLFVHLRERIKKFMKKIIEE